MDIASIFMHTTPTLLQNLERDSEYLQQQLQQFLPISNDFVTKFAYETYPTPIFGGRSLLVVPKASAVVPGAANAEPIAMTKDHRGMISFDSAEDESYQRLRRHIESLAKTLPKAIHEEKHHSSLLSTLSPNIYFEGLEKPR